MRLLQLVLLFHLRQKTQPRRHTNQQVGHGRYQAQVQLLDKEFDSVFFRLVLLRCEATVLRNSRG